MNMLLYVERVVWLGYRHFVSMYGRVEKMGVCMVISESSICCCCCVMTELS